VYDRDQSDLLVETISGVHSREIHGDPLPHASIQGAGHSRHLPANSQPDCHLRGREITGTSRHPGGFPDLHGGPEAGAIPPRRPVTPADASLPRSRGLNGAPLVGDLTSTLQGHRSLSVAAALPYSPRTAHPARAGCAEWRSRSGSADLSKALQGMRVFGVRAGDNPRRLKPDGDFRGLGPPLGVCLTKILGSQPDGDLHGVIFAPLRTRMCLADAMPALHYAPRMTVVSALSPAECWVLRVRAAPMSEQSSPSRIQMSSKRSTDIRDYLGGPQASLTLSATRDIASRAGLCPVDLSL